jgi:ApaG protein
MLSSITEGVLVAVETEYHPEYSNPINNHYVFTYRIRIENQGDYALRLLRRHWYIYDSIGSRYEVEGEGVVGQQPLILPNAHHTYVSGCHLKSDMGKMYGKYLMEREVDGALFWVQIPEFALITPTRFN